MKDFNLQISVPKTKFLAFKGEEHITPKVVVNGKIVEAWLSQAVKSPWTRQTQKKEKDLITFTGLLHVH